MGHTRWVERVRGEIDARQFGEERREEGRRNGVGGWVDEAGEDAS